VFVLCHDNSSKIGDIRKADPYFEGKWSLKCHDKKGVRIADGLKFACGRVPGQDVCGINGRCAFPMHIPPFEKADGTRSCLCFHHDIKKVRFADR